MQTTATTRTVATVAVAMTMTVAVTLSTSDAQARTPASTDPIAAVDHEDHHHRPPIYDDPTLKVPPASGADPDYPLAVAFVPADPSNYTNGGITSYDYVVVHTMQGYYAGSMSWFQNPMANVSAHYVMRAEDGEVTQMVRNDDRAWHVGSSNSYALGIEHEGFITEPEWYTWETYLSSARLTRWLCEEFSIPVDRDHVVGHVELPSQTHTDPGNFWDWPLYMALIRDAVPEGRVEGVVVDRSMACTITASTDTWVKATLEDAAELGDPERCMVPAGTELTYLHASEDMVGHVRLYFDLEGAPCSGVLAEQGFVFSDHFDALCDPASMVATGAEVTLDGGAPVAVDAEGRFSLDGIAPGAYMLDATAADFMPGMAPFDVEVYPGARVVLGLDPVPGQADTGGSEGGEGGEAGESGGPDPDGTTSGPPPGGTAGSDGIDPSGPLPTSADGGGDDRALPPGFGEDDGGGCSCTSGDPSPIGPWMLMGLVWGVLRRRD